MRRIDQILGVNLFKVDSISCSLNASTFSNYRANVEKTPWGELPLNNQLIFKIAFISICHQFNWDFLQNRLAEKLLQFDDPKEIINVLSNIDARIIKDWLYDYPKPERIKAAERASLLRDVGNKISEICKYDSTQLYESSDHYVGGDSGFIKNLDIFQAYNLDPLRKKSYVLVHDLVREKILHFNDEKNIEPAIDYHIMRVYLRTGRVIPTRIEAFEELKGKPKPRARLVKLLRKSVSEALKACAFYSKLSVPDVNFIEWQIGRTVCTKESPNCQRKSDLPDLDQDIRKLFKGHCPFIAYCNAFNNPEWRKLEEPNFKKTFY